MDPLDIGAIGKFDFSIRGLKSFFTLGATARQVVALASLSAILAGVAYYYQENYLSYLPSIQYDSVRAVRMLAVYVAIPFAWVVLVKKEKIGNLGITKKNILWGTVLGIGVYAIALLVFIASIGKPSFDSSFVAGYRNKPLLDIAITTCLVAVMAMVTDIWTRGFVLMMLAKHKSIAFGIAAQNVTWFLVHIYEIIILMDALTLPGAVALTLTLGILGDVVALKTKNIIGLGIGHIVLNAGFAAYILLFL